VVQVRCRFGLLVQQRDSLSDKGPVQQLEQAANSKIGTALPKWQYQKIVVVVSVSACLSSSSMCFERQPVELSDKRGYWAPGRAGAKPLHCARTGNAEVFGTLE
jgi:hypothetical protein